MKRLNEVLNNEEKNYILPFFWQHGEDEETLRDYMKHISEAGIKAVCVESRPHPDFVGPLWWRDMDIIMDEARKRKMKVWVLDDSHFPTGYAAGKVKEKHPELKKWYLNAHRMDFPGPLKDASFIMKYYPGRASAMPGYKGENKVLAVIAAKISDTETGAIEEDTLIDVSQYVQDGVLYWDLPEGNWSIFVVFMTRDGGEEVTKDYLNPIVAEATRVLIDVVYETHYNRYKEDFGKTLAGFFSDEPRFGNMKGFEGSIGRTKMVLPWSNDMLEMLESEIGEEVLLKIPLLFADGVEDEAHTVRYHYMDIVSKLYGKNFTTQLGDWCRDHGVEYIGHIIEDNGSHSRLGYGPGHFFRALEGQDMAGIDVIGGQIVPGMDFLHSGFTAAGWDGEFFHYGLAKLGSSLAHLDPKKKGRTMCEVFGAYGWVEGLKSMKWLTDHLLVRGVNNFVPHAFSPKPFPDWDCPPHFYAGGNDSQFRFMKIWSDYTNRISHLLSEGTHIAPVAVLYHGEAEWSGDYMPFHKVVKKLLQNQIDCDVIPADVFNNDIAVSEGQLLLNNERFRCLVIPYAEALPKKLLNSISELAEKGLKVIFINKLPVRISEGVPEEKLITALQDSNNCEIAELDKVVERIKSFGINEIALTTFEPHLTYYHYKHKDEDIFMFFNEQPYNRVDTKVYIPLSKKAVWYDGFTNELETCEYKLKDEGLEVELSLGAYESKLLIFGNEEIEARAATNTGALKQVEKKCIQGSWKVSMAEALDYPNYKEHIKLDELVDLSKPSLYPNFSGTIRYEINFEVKETLEKAFLDLGRVYEIAELWLNGESLGVRICPPYKFDISSQIKKGNNSLIVEVTNTLVKAHKDAFSQYAVQEPTGLLGPVQVSIYNN